MNREDGYWMTATWAAIETAKATGVGRWLMIALGCGFQATAGETSPHKCNMIVSWIPLAEKTHLNTAQQDLNKVKDAHFYSAFGLDGIGCTAIFYSKILYVYVCCVRIQNEGSIEPDFHTMSQKLYCATL
jgi:hypothetical protein